MQHVIQPRPFKVRRTHRLRFITSHKQWTIPTVVIQLAGQGNYYKGFQRRQILHFIYSDAAVIRKWVFVSSGAR